MLALIITLLALSSPASARDLGQWENQPTYVRQWFQKLMQPDNPLMSCCGEADAYWADSFEVDDGRYVATITDERYCCSSHGRTRYVATDRALWRHGWAGGKLRR